MDMNDQLDCEANIREIEELLSCGIFEPANSTNILQSSAFIQLMICLRDLLGKTAKHVKRISWVDDVMANEYVADITDAVTAVRDACCHIDSFKRRFDVRGGRGSFNVIYGKGCLAKIGNVELRSDYEDDIAYFYGKNRLYMNRHIIRAFKEARALLQPMLRPRPF
jgi:hypothetical protein